MKSFLKKYWYAIGLSGWGLFLLAGKITPGYAQQNLWPAEQSAQPAHQAVTHSTLLTSTLYLPLVTSYWADVTPNFGVQFYGPLDTANGLDIIAQGGARWIRVPLNWAAIEPANTTPAYYNWSSLDTSINNATAQNINLVLMLAGQPSWVAAYPMGPVSDTAELHQFFGALVERYDGDGVDDVPGSAVVKYFEIYNEPDNGDIGHAIHGGWGYWGHNGAGYAALLRELYPAIKSANPQAQIVFGGLALDWFEDQGGIFVRSFLDDVLAACRGYACFDVMNFHYYPPYRPNWEPYGKDIIGKANYVRQKMAAYGLSTLPLICTESSWGSGGTWGSPELQNRYVVKVFARSLAARLPITIWFMKTDGNEPSLPGLLNNDLTPKPSYQAFNYLTRQLNRAVYQRTLTTAETGSSQIEGYVFQAGRYRIDVLWTEDSTWTNPNDDPWLPFTAVASRLQVVDKSGNGRIYTDAEDGIADGRITVLVGGSPLYLIYEP